MQKYDVIIVGAGPAGSTCALFLAEKFNRNVLLIDKENFPRDKVCGGYLTSRVFRRFKYLKGKISEITEVPTYGSHFYGPDLAKLSWIKEQPVGYLALRLKFDNYLKELAVSKGVKFIGGNEVIDLVVAENRAKVLTQNGSSHSADIVIGADGVRSLIAKKCNIHEKPGVMSKGLCVESEFQVPEEFLDENFGRNRPTHYYYGFGNIIGYAWAFPKKTHVNVGIGGPTKQGREMGRSFLEFLDYLKEEMLLPKSFEITKKFKAALIPTSTALYLNQSYSDRVLLAGDALGVASSISGEGIYQSMASGEDAAIMANQALDDQKFDSNYLRQYAKIWKKDLGRELKTAGNIMMQLSSSENINDLLRKMKIFFDRMKEERDLFDYFATTFFGIK